MKLVTLSTIFFAKLAFADLDSIFEQMGNMVKANNMSIEGEIGAMMRAAIDENREFVDPILSALQPIYNYGCWCHFGDQWVHAGGKVQDTIDARCKQLINGYRCAKMDGNDRGEDCDAGNVPYVTYNYFGGAPIVSDCTNSNPGDQCAIDACIIEGQFTLDFLVDIVAGSMGNLVNANYQGAPSGTWDRDAECTVGNTPAGDRECCGSQPNRSPYSLAKGVLACCNDQTLYNIATHQCCVSGSTPVIGAAC